MNPPNHARAGSRASITLVLLLGAGAAGAVPMLELVTSDQTYFTEKDMVYGGRATVTYTLQVSGLDTTPGQEDVVLAYDLGIAYDPYWVRLTSFSFDSGNYLGDPDIFDVLQQDPADNTNDLFVTNPPQADSPVHSTWDWRDNSNVNNPAPTGQDFVGLNEPLYGVPAAVADYSVHQGSIRFAAASLLDNASLIALQIADRPSEAGTVPLATLVFSFSISGYYTAPIDLIYGTDYNPSSSELDVKISSPTIAKYPTRVNGSITVPEPGTLPLFAAALAGLGLWGRRLRRR